MATPLSADKMLSALKAEGSNPVEYKEWRTHDRNHIGSWGPVHGVVIHHTAGSNSLSLVYNGRSDLPGPLAHAHLAKDGTLSLTSNGRANHGGLFTQNAHDAVLNESSIHPRPSGSEVVDANQHYYGIEIENLGNGNDPYPDKQYGAAVRWAAAICRAYGWSADSVIGHKEGTTRKIDPSFDMDQFRRAVHARLTGVTPETEEDVVTNEDIKKIADAVWDRLLVSGDEEYTAASWLKRARGSAKSATERSRSILEVVDVIESDIEDIKVNLAELVRSEVARALVGATVELHISE